MELMPSQLRDRLPGLGKNRGAPLETATVHVRYFDPASNWCWYVLEFDGEDTCFGFVLTKHQALAGEFTISELRALRYHEEGLGEVGVERDTYFEPLTVEQLSQREPNMKYILNPESGLGLVSLDDS